MRCPEVPPVQTVLAADSAHRTAGAAPTAARPPDDTSQAQLVPLVFEMAEPVDLPGVALYMHQFADRLEKAPIRTSRFTIEPRCGTVEDRHSVHEIWFVSRGCLELLYDGGCHRLSAGQAVYFEPWKPHIARNVGPDTSEVFSMWWS